MNSDLLFKVLSAIHTLRDDFRQALKKELTEVSLPRNHFLLETNAIPNRAYFLTKGFSMSYTLREIKKTAISFWRPGEIILSPKSFFEQIPSPEFIQLTADSELLFITYESVARLFEQFPVANALARSITADYHQKSEQRIIDLQTLSAWQRYRNLLKTYPGIEQSVSQDIIAAFLGITPQSLSRLKRIHHTD